MSVTDTPPTRFGGSEEVCQIAARTSLPGHRVEEVVHDAENLSVTGPCAEAEDWRFWIE